MTDYKRKKFVAPELLEEAVDQIDELARQAKVRIALIGGYAMQLYGSDRLTGDVDFIADGPLRSLPPGPPLSFGGEQTQAPNDVPVDWILRVDELAPLYEAALDAARALPGGRVRVATPEYLAIMKMAARRSRDTLDLQFLIASRAIDVVKTRAIAKRHLGLYAGHEFDRIVDETLWKASQGKL